MSLFAQLNPFRPSLRYSHISVFCLKFARYASINSAINRGIRKTRRIEDFQPKTHEYYDQSEKKISRSQQRTPRQRDQPWHREHEFDDDEFIRTGKFRALPREHQRFQSSQMSSRSPFPSLPEKARRRADRVESIRTHKSTDTAPERVKEHVRVPETIPYTTPASEFIYGTAAVEAALRCNRRQIYKLYIYQAAGEELNAAKVSLRKLALSKNIKVKMAFAGWDRLLDKMSAGRPHNGCILEASPLPRLPVKGLNPVKLQDDYFTVDLAPQSREEAVVNGSNNHIAINHPLMQQRKRYPVILLLDGILDPGNLGAIIRSSYYLGVDAVVFAGRNSAPLSPVTIKASAGAAENMTLLDVKNEVDFIQRSKANGWRFYAADAPSLGSSYIDPSSVMDGNSTASTDDGNGTSRLVIQSPTVIMMGSEGTGLSPHVRAQADSIVSIPGARHHTSLDVTSDPARVDSLNVSVAAALLMEMFLRVPLAVAAPLRKENPW